MNEFTQGALDALDGLEKQAKLPGWAKAYAILERGLVRVNKWPQSKKLTARLKMLQQGRLNAPLHRKGGFHPTFAGKPGTGKPAAGWPAGSAMDRWRKAAGRE